MSIYRRAAKVDTTQKVIVEALEKAGCIVVAIRQPVDLMVRHPRWPAGLWRLAEVKTPSRKDGSYRPRKDQETQNEFVDTYGVPRLTTPESALEWLRSVE